MSNNEMVKSIGDLVNYDITDAGIKEYIDQYANVDTSTKEGYALAKKGISLGRDLRLKVERRRKEIKGEAVAFIDGEAKRIQSLINPVEDELKAKKKVIDDEKARIKAEKERIERERISAIKASIDELRGLGHNLMTMDIDQLNEAKADIDVRAIEEDQFQEFLVEAKHTHRAVSNAIEAAITQRIIYDEQQAAQERQRQWLDEKRKQAEEDNQKERAKIKAEQDKLREEKANIEKERLELEALRNKQKEESAPIVETSTSKPKPPKKAKTIEAEKETNVVEIESAEPQLESPPEPSPEEVERPSDIEIITCISNTFSVTQDEALSWIMDINHVDAIGEISRTA